MTSTVAFTTSAKRQASARVLVVGGYGVFGGRVAERLAREADLDVIVAGRDQDRARIEAQRLAIGAIGRIGWVVIDAAQTTAKALRAIAPSVVVNASGPFQSQDYSLAASAIEAGCHYVDIADARNFVTGIAVLDAAAKKGDVLVVSGASSVPGLSSAVVAALAPRFDRLETLDLAISPGNSFDPGLATTRSVIGGVGQPIRTLQGGIWSTVYGWQGLGRLAPAGAGARWVAYCDVPDLELFPAAYPGLRTVRFRAGMEVPVFHFGLWGLSWPARVGLLRGLERLAGPLLAVKRRLGFLGTDVGAMVVTIGGRDAAGKARSQTWQLVAGSGHGPYIPAICAVILARKLARGEVAQRGATSCMGLVSLAEFEREVADLDMRMGMLSEPLYLRALGPDFARMPAPVRALHSLEGTARWTGRADVVRGPSRLARWLCDALGLPPAGRDVPLTVTFSAGNGEEVWERRFGNAVFRSRQRLARRGVGLIDEIIGPIRLRLRPIGGPGGLALEVVGAAVLGVPLPRFLHPRITTLEQGPSGRYTFDVGARLPVIAELIRYQGWLVPVPVNDGTPAPMDQAGGSQGDRKS